ncbi:hypothetical protein DH2020_033602 [Rehmannia glutinosa]|uniref:Hexosyltransferase n=1 Tax=Rehmannia glutinosa TaxID=99300 RepID=A0ABR0VBT2_REHGL
MPSSPKLFYARPSSWNSHRSTALILCLLVGFSCFIFGFVAISRRGLGNKCKYGKPLSVSVTWDKSSTGSTSKDGGISDEGQKRHKVMGFVGIQTGFGSTGRRRSLRQTWFPSDHQGLQRLAFFKAAYALYESDFYVKADDDIYLRPDRLSLLLAKERPHSQTYLGCMKKGPVFTDPKLKWYEPHSDLLGKDFRMFSNEDVTIGSWMLAMNVNHEDSKELCHAECMPSSIAVWDIPKCSGLCNPEKRMLELHSKDICSKSSTLPADEEEEE